MMAWDFTFSDFGSSIALHPRWSGAFPGRLA